MANVRTAPKAIETPKDPNPNDVVIAVMGATGSGKSTFINTLTGSKLKTSDGLRSCTTEVAARFFRIDDKRVVLVDTPGFDDTTKSDADILKLIATWLETTYRTNHRLSGIVYLHRISDVRIGGGGFRNLRIFRDLVGSEAMPNVLLVSTFWGSVEKSVGERRERELQNDDGFWKSMLQQGAQLARYDGSKDQAMNFVYQFFNQPKTTLQIQRELVEEERQLIDTSAGRNLNADLKKLHVQYSKEMENVRKDMQEAIAAKDQETLEILRKEKEETRVKLEAVEKRQTALSEARDREITEFTHMIQEAESKGAEALAREMEKARRDKEDLERQLRETDYTLVNQRAEAQAIQRQLWRLEEQQQQREQNEGNSFWEFMADLVFKTTITILTGGLAGGFQLF